MDYNKEDFNEVNISSELDLIQLFYLKIYFSYLLDYFQEQILYQNYNYDYHHPLTMDIHKMLY